MASEMFLYWGSGSPPCWRAMLVLEEKGLSGYPNKLVSFEKKEHKSEEILKWNPRGQVPTFIHNNHAVNESLAICDYLEAQFAGQGTKLYPDDPVERGFVLQRKYEAENLAVKGRDVIHYVMWNKPENIKQDDVNKKKSDFFEELAIWEGYLSKSAAGDSDGGFLASKQLTMADIVFFPHLAIFVRFGLELEPKFPHLARYYQKMLQQQSVKKSWPPHWVGTEAPKKLFVAA